MSNESDAIYRAFYDRWDQVVRPLLADGRSPAEWPRTADAAETRASLGRLEEIAEGGDLFAAEQLAELLALDGPTHDAAAAYRWYYVVLSQQGYTVEFKDENGTPPDYCGPVGDFRNEAMVSGLVSELGFERAQELDCLAAEWLSRKGLA